MLKRPPNATPTPVTKATKASKATGRIHAAHQGSEKDPNASASTMPVRRIRMPAPGRPDARCIHTGCVRARTHAKSVWCITMQTHTPFNLRVDCGIIARETKCSGGFDNWFFVAHSSSLEQRYEPVHVSAVAAHRSHLRPYTSSSADMVEDCTVCACTGQTCVVENSGALNNIIYFIKIK